MWCEAGFQPDAFWHQTPRSFQMAMRGVRRRGKAEAEARLSHAWHTAAFTGATQSKQGLKPLDHYVKRKPQRMSHRQMLASMRALAANVNRKCEAGA